MPDSGPGCESEPDSESETEKPGEGHGGGRRWTTGLIIAFLAFQIAMPLSYYLGDDSWDERFAWRMFSTTRLTNCQSQARRVSEQGRPEGIQIWHDVQIAWRNLIRRNRDQVVRAFLQRRCRRDGDGRVQVRTNCSKPGGERSRHTWSMDCDSKSVAREDEVVTP